MNGNEHSGRHPAAETLTPVATALPPAALVEVERLAARDSLGTATMLRVLVLEALRARGWTA